MVSLVTRLTKEDMESSVETEEIYWIKNFLKYF